MQRPINDTPMERMSADYFLRQELDRLAPALHGFPVEPLVSAFTSAAATERQGAARLVEHCLGGWIASLDATLDGYTDNLGDALQHVQGRQRAARDALATLKTALSRVELDHARGG